MTIRGLAQNLATAAEVQFNLMRLMMAMLFTSASGEEQSTYFRQEADPDETQSIITGMEQEEQASLKEKLLCYHIKPWKLVQRLCIWVVCPRGHSIELALFKPSHTLTDRPVSFAWAHGSPKPSNCGR